MPPPRQWRTAAALAAALFSGQALFSGAALAQEAACQSAYVATQRLKRAARLREARREAVACGQDSCSATVRADCITWLADIERALPTLVIDARDANGATVADLRIEANAELLTERWDGRALELDPGEYTLRIQHDQQVVEVHTLIHEAEKYRTVQMRFEAVPGAAAATLASAPVPRAAAAVPGVALAPQAVTAPLARPALSDAPAPPPVLSYALGGLSLAGIGTFALLGMSGYTSEQHLRERCAGACRAADVDSVRTRYLVADVGLGVGVSAGIAAVALWIWSPPHASASLALGPSSVRWQGAF